MIIIDTKIITLKLYNEPEVVITVKFILSKQSDIYKKINDLLTNIAFSLLCNHVKI